MLLRCTVLSCKRGMSTERDDLGGFLWTLNVEVIKKSGRQQEGMLVLAGDDFTENGKLPSLQTRHDVS